MVKYLIRLDDACPYMNKTKWQEMEDLLDMYAIKPLVGIVPDCKDENLMIDNMDPLFWEKAKKWQEKEWAIALHGYDHCYISDGGMNGLNPLWRRSEFAGVQLKTQRYKIRQGVALLNSHGIKAKYFFAPSHTFDRDTLMALKEESDIRIISDTVATKPYKLDDFSVIPQVGGHCSKILIPGIWTFCLHPNMMSEEIFKQTKSFIQNNRNSFISFSEIDLTNLKGKSIVSRFISWLYFERRKHKGIK